MTGEESRELARRKARFGHRDWIVWQNRKGEFFAEPATAATVKKAMLAVGLRGSFTCYAASKGTAHYKSWPLALRWFLNLRYEERAAIAQVG